MKKILILLTIISTMLIATQIPTKYIEEHTNVICKAGYLFVVASDISGVSITQIFGKSKHKTNPIPQPIRCCDINKGMN